MVQAELLKILKPVAAKFDKPVMLASGKTSDYFIDVKKAILTQAGLRVVSEKIIMMLKEADAKSVGGIESGSLPLLGVIVEKTGLPGFYVRKNKHGRGMGKQIEGNLVSPAVIVEDVTTSGANSLNAAKVVISTGAEVLMVISVVDRNEGATEAYARRQIPFHALCRSSDLL
jgi:orotate phosphoribosyltransferase